MEYKKIAEAVFLDRPNRFIARVLVDGREETVHVKNTGRCRELLKPGVRVYLSDEQGSKRKTRYDLVAVEKGNRIINMDSQAPNQEIGRWLRAGGLFEDVVEVRPEFTYGQSRFDFLVVRKEGKVLLEVKGVTLEEENVAFFPDAPSQRAVKHINELVQARKEGYETWVLFLIQMEGIRWMAPNDRTQPAFGECLRRAQQEGVRIAAFDTRVWPSGMLVQGPVPVYLNGEGLYRDGVWPLLEWYHKGHRQLPWRENRDPYRIWVSEIMLQQTRVEAVKPYFERFMEQLPNVEALAEVEEEVLLKLWEGLGYYSRARNLKKAAGIIMEKYGGRIPKTYEELIGLPGIGSYTAGAISSIAFGQRAPAVDGNVLRILSRLAVREEDITRPETKRKLEQILASVIPESCPGDFNQALMELGATVCLPGGKPKCRDCPWERLCLAHRQGREEDFPLKKPKPERKIEKRTILLIRDDGRSAIRKRPDTGLLAGMYEFPGLDGHKSEKRVLEYIKQMGLVPLQIQKLAPSKHIFSHREWHMIAYRIRVDELAPESEILKQEAWIYAKPEEIAVKYPIPSAFSAYLEETRQERNGGRGAKRGRKK